MGWLKEPESSREGLATPKRGSPFSTIIKKVKFRNPRKKPHKTLKAVGKGIKGLKMGKWLKEMYEADE